MIPFSRIILIAFMVTLVACTSNPGDDSILLERLSPSKTGIRFTNELKEDEKMNITEYLYYYNGAGVSVGDFNQDGLEDLFFVSNKGDSKLYLNKGDFKFEDITEESGIKLSGNWHTGSNVADINQDGFPDLLVCGVSGYKNLNGQNQVFINNGNLTFTDKTQELGLTFLGFSTHTTFFDYDQDGDLDLYLLNHSVHTVRSVGTVGLRNERDTKAGDVLYENRLIPEGKPYFVDATSKSKIYNSAVGYGLGIGAGDVNMDGRTDLYVSNDFFENDYLYLNQGDGSFKEVAEQAFSHTSRFSMGNTISDINNDLMPDILSLDMLPWQEPVIKSSAGEDPFDIFEYKKRLGFHYQFARNTLQLNRGVDRNGIPRFSDIAPLAGVEATDWSWAPLAADWDNDGWKDVFISNGINRRPNDMDYISFISADSANTNKNYKTYLENMPAGTVPNAIFRNSGSLKFENMSGKWFESKPGLSNGAVYSDLDNDGDLDLAVNNIGEPAGIFRNNQKEHKGLLIELKGDAPNQEAIGAKLFLYQQGQTQYQEVQPSRGFQSSVTRRIHFGLGKSNQPDSLVIHWPDGSIQKEIFQEPLTSALVKIKKSSSTPLTSENKGFKSDPIVFEVIYEGAKHVENPYSAFQTERLIPHSLDAPGPMLAVGDIDRNGKKDLYRSGTSAGGGTWLFQFQDGRFKKSETKKAEVFQADESAVKLFDADGDGDEDLFVLHGGQQPLIPTAYFPELWLNDGNGNFKQAINHLPTLALNGSVVAISDMDRDGDQDVFLGGNVVPANYGLIPYSYLLVNDGKGRFLNQTALRLPGTEGRLGMITDAEWNDLNGDGFPDLILAGEWMSLQIWINQQGRTLQDESEKWKTKGINGLWHSLSSGDFDGDGDIDLMAGNHGLNSRLRASSSNPVTMYITDLDDNSSIDQLIEYQNNGQPFPFWSRDQLTKQVPSLKKHFLKYSTYRDVTTQDIIKLSGKITKESRQLTELASAFFENSGGQFIFHQLPLEVQFSPVFAICPTDFNGDSFTDFLIGGNLFSVTPEVGRMNASYGTVLIGKGKGQFETLNPIQSGLLLNGECRDIQVLDTTAEHIDFAIGLNNLPLKVVRFYKGRIRQ